MGAVKKGAGEPLSKNVVNKDHSRDSGRNQALVELP